MQVIAFRHIANVAPRFHRCKRLLSFLQRNFTTKNSAFGKIETAYGAA